MKQLLTLLIGLLISLQSFGQLTFVGEISGAMETMLVGDNQDAKNLIENNRLIPMKESNIKFKLYHQNFSLYKTITIDTAGFNGMQVEAVWFSDHFIDTDDEVEIIYRVINSGWKTEKIVFMNEDGVIFDTKMDESLNKITFIGNDLYLITIGKQVGSNPSTFTFKFYKAGGNYPCKVTCGNSSSTSQIPAPQYNVSLFPNPATNQITIQHDINKTNLKVRVYATTGALLFEEELQESSTIINTTSLSAGNYVYSIFSGSEVVQSSVFVIK